MSMNATQEELIDNEHAPQSEMRWISLMFAIYELKNH